MNIVDHLSTTLTGQETAELLTHNDVIRRAGDNIASRRSPYGGVGSRLSGRGVSDVRIRHTTMVLLALISDSTGHLGGHSRPDAVTAMAQYLQKYGGLWRSDTSHLFGCTMAVARLINVLATGAPIVLVADPRRRGPQGARLAGDDDRALRMTYDVI